MIRSRSLLLSAARGAACLLLLNVSVPLGAVTTVGKPVVEGLRAKADREAAEAAEQARREKRRVKSRPLTAKEQRTEQGRSGPNPYLAGQSKWDVMYKGVNLMTGAYTSGGNDLSFDGGYGIPVNVTRSYNSNTVDEGPFGKGWTLSADVRSTAGGMLKSPGAPVRTVPSSFKERPITEFDPNLPTGGGPQGSQGGQPVEAVVATDASGEEETIQKDADGVLTTPPWDKNVIDSTYETLVKADGSVYQLLTANTVKTPDGTVYQYTKQGAYGTWNAGTQTYTGGTRPWNNPSAAPDPANVLKVVSATDRQGNQTTYSYGSGWVTFQKMNGTVTEHPLTKVEMPNGHKINFTWGTGSLANRIVDIDDGLANASDRRHVEYGYTNGYLTSVKSPGGKVTSYGYSGSYLTSITDPRGFQESIGYGDAYVTNLPWGGYMGVTAVVALSHANGTSTEIQYNPPSSSADVYVYEKVGSVPLSHFYLQFAGGGPSSPTLTVKAGANSSGAVPTGTQTQMSMEERNLSTKVYNAFTQDLTSQQEQWLAYPTGGGGPDTDIRLVAPTQMFATRAETKYNFQGLPVSQTTYEKGPTSTTGAFYSNKPLNQIAWDSSSTYNYAYWGADKYWQKKASIDDKGCVSFTDYYDASAATGRKGQVKAIYDDKYSDFIEDVLIAYPVATPSNSTWRYRLVPRMDGVYLSVPLAMFDYDAKGRSIWVDKLRSVTGTGGSQAGAYVRTTTQYGADTDGSWGQPILLTEDVGGLMRKTETLHFNAQGKADIVKDARLNAFRTVYKKDGEVETVDQVNPSTFGIIKNIATYTYGGKPGVDEPNTPGDWARYGQLKTVTDGISGISQTFEYGAADGAKGQVMKVTEHTPSTIGTSLPDYWVDYTYWPSGDRATSATSTSANTEVWQYADYLPVGSPTGQSRVFQTMRKLTQSGAYTPEEMHYRYDERGRLTATAFAQTPYRNAQSQFYETNGATPYYQSAYNTNGTGMASARCVAEYLRDAAGRVKYQEHRWENRSATGVMTPIVLSQETNTYATSGNWKGLKTNTSLTVLEKNAGNWANHTRSDAYEYDGDRGYLTKWTPSDQTFAFKSWSYDAAGNRNGGTYDALNRMSVYGTTATYGLDAAGNRLSRMSSAGTTNYEWDPLNRMASAGVSTGYNSYYHYRADGLRAAQLRSASGTQTRITAYRYDGSMPVEEAYTFGSTVETTRFAVGPRGTERQALTTSTTTDVSYPLYDAHGNAFASVRRDTGNPGGYVPLSASDVRAFDPWGNGIVSSNVGSNTGFGMPESGRPVQAYCGSLGHRKDDETGLIYMRARYYDPQVGRFTSEDPARSGRNWYAYASNNPVSGNDPTGLMTGSIDVSLSSAEEVIEKLEEVKFFQTAQGAQRAKIEGLMYGHQGEVMAYLEGTITELNFTATGVEMTGQNSLKMIFLDTLSKHALMEGVHLDFQLMGANGARAFLDRFIQTIDNLFFL